MSTPDYGAILALAGWPAAVVPADTTGTRREWAQRNTPPDTLPSYIYVKEYLEPAAKDPQWGKKFPATRVHNRLDSAGRETDKSEMVAVAVNWGAAAGYALYVDQPGMVVKVTDTGISFMDTPQREAGRVAFAVPPGPVKGGELLPLPAQVIQWAQNQLGLQAPPPARPKLTLRAHAEGAVIDFSGYTGRYGDIELLSATGSNTVIMGPQTRKVSVMFKSDESQTPRATVKLPAEMAKEAMTVSRNEESAGEKNDRLLSHRTVTAGGSRLHFMREVPQTPAGRAPDATSVTFVAYDGEVERNAAFRYRDGKPSSEGDFTDGLSIAARDAADTARMLKAKAAEAPAVPRHGNPGEGAPPRGRGKTPPGRQ